MRVYRFICAFFALFFVVCSTATGSRAWIANGSIVCGMPGSQISLRAVPDGAGGVIVTWQDARNGDSNCDIFAQRVSAGGAALWAEGGVAVCSEAHSQSAPCIVSDGMNGAIIAWQDGRNGTTNADIYAQRIDAGGALLWPENGVPVCMAAAGQTAPCIASDGVGGAIVAWEDHRNGGSNSDIYGQGVGAGGSPRWGASGIPVCSYFGDQLEPRIVSDGAGGAIVAWTDLRDFENTWTDIYAQRIDATGACLWLSIGINVSQGAQFEYSLAIDADGTGGAVLAWTDCRRSPFGTFDYDIFANRINGDGAPRWGASSLAVSTRSGSQREPAILGSGSGSATIAWIDPAGGGSRTWAHRVRPNGAFAWAQPGIAVCNASILQSHPAIVTDGAGGAIVVWEDARGADKDIYAQRFDSIGALVWPADGVCLTLSEYDQSAVTCVSDGAGGAIAAWEDMLTGTSDILAQRIHGSGEMVATLLQSHAAAWTGRAIELAWTLASLDDGTVFDILRAEGPEPAGYRALSSIAPASDLSCSFADSDVEPGESYRYRVDAVTNGERRPLFEEGPVTVPAARLSLEQNRPNPCNPGTTIAFSLPERADVTIDIFDARGALVRRLAEGPRDRGSHTLVWDGRTSNGTPAGSGVYFYRLSAGKETLSRTMILAR